MSDEFVQSETVDDAIAVVSFSRPEKRNALNIEVIEGLTTTLRALATDRQRRVVVLRGEGPAFCAGLDLKEAADSAKTRRSAESLAMLYETMVTSPLVIIAAAHGAAMGGGAGLVLAADLVVAGEDLQLGFPEVRRGLVAALVTVLLRQHVNDAAARRIILLGQTLDIRACERLNLLTRISTSGQVLDDAMALAKQTLTGAPDAIVRSKRLLNEMAPRPIAQDLQTALRHHLDTRSSAESAEGIAAFREKREPRWGERSL